MLVLLLPVERMVVTPAAPGTRSRTSKGFVNAL